MSGVDSWLTGKPPAAKSVAQPVTAVVVRSDASGVWAAIVGGDRRHPIGPCYGGRRRNDAGDLEQLPADTLVLLVTTAGGPWIAGWEET